MHAFLGKSFQINQMLGFKTVVQSIVISRTNIYEMINKKSKFYSTFPCLIRLSKSFLGWLACRVKQWIEYKLQDRRMIEW